MEVSNDTEANLASAADLRTWTSGRWHAFVTSTDAQDETAWETATDVAGWTIKDHVAHVIRWDESLIALVRDGIPRQVTLMVADEAWQAGGYDAMNEAIRLQTEALSVAEIRARRDATWSELFALLETYDDATLQRPGKDFGLAYGHNETFLETLVDDLGVHYDQHRQYIQRILATATISTPEQYAELAELRWSEYQEFLDGLEPRDWANWTDAGGWTVKDHVAHVSAWDRAWTSQASGGKTQREFLDVPDDVWSQGFDAINETLRKRSLASTHDDVRAESDSAIKASRASLSSIDLTQKANTLGLASADSDMLLLDVFTGDQAEHYELHHRYMDRIVDEGRARYKKSGT